MKIISAHRITVYIEVLKRPSFYFRDSGQIKNLFFPCGTPQWRNKSNFSANLFHEAVVFHFEKHLRETALNKTNSFLGDRQATWVEIFNATTMTFGLWSRRKFEFQIPVSYGVPYYVSCISSFCSPMVGRGPKIFSPFCERYRYIRGIFTIRWSELSKRVMYRQEILIKVTPNNIELTC